MAVRHRDRSVSYGELDDGRTDSRRRSSQQASEKGSRIAYIDRSAPEVIELLFAASKIGAVAVPLNWRLAVPELRVILEDAEPPVLIAGPAYEAVAEELAGR